MLGFTTHLVELLDGMVNPDPRKRFTIAQACYLGYISSAAFKQVFSKVPSLVRKATSFQSRSRLHVCTFSGGHGRAKFR